MHARIAGIQPNCNLQARSFVLHVEKNNGCLHLTVSEFVDTLENIPPGRAVACQEEGRVEIQALLC